MKKIVQTILRFFAKQVLKKYQPEIIGITDSVGKTSTKEAVFSVLANKFEVRENIKNYNNEIGLPLSILGLESGKKSVFKWLAVSLKALKLILVKDKDYPKILVLEMGADHPGDIKYLVDFVPCKVGIVTRVAPVHIEFFENLDAIAKEKGILIKHLTEDGLAVLNFDDERVKKMKGRTKAKVLSFGFNEGADVRATEAVLSGQGADLKGMSFKLLYQGNAVPVFLPGVLGNHQIYAALAAAAVGIYYKLNLIDIIEALKNYQSPRGRMNLIKGIKDSLIIDDTYNASPDATIAALETLSKIRLSEESRKFAVLSDMLELGEYTEEGHYNVGKRAAELRIDYLVTVGERAKNIAKGALENGLSEDQIFSFSNTEEAGKFLQEKLGESDLLLVKGSQGMRMEKVVKELMTEPLKACDLLVRQDPEWECR